MKTLIITVGTRQAGWRCQDGTVCCFGADGDRGHPRHINRLFQELGVERGRRQVGEHTYDWGVQDLSHLYYRHCQETLKGNFRAVELLLDHQVLEAQYSQGLDQVVLWGTNQPETTDWTYRDKDTRWLAHLMAGKIRQTWPELQAEVFEPVVDANDNQAIRQALDAFIVEYTQRILPDENEEELTLFIQNKGAVPAIAQSLEICAAGLVRQYPVFSLIPIEPVPLYSGEVQSANRSQKYQEISIGEYFWPIERLRIVSAWQRGDFHEAALWLMAHQSKYRLVYRLAKCLTLATNWQMETFCQGRKAGLAQWLGMASSHQVVEPTQLDQWQATFENLRKHSSAQTWETRFLIYLLLRQSNYTDAFMRFAQILERLLYLRSKEEGWFSKQELKKEFHPTFYELIKQWFELRDKSTKSSYNQFDRIRKQRNQVVHKAAPMTLKDISDIWKDQKSIDGMSEVLAVEAVYGCMTKMLSEVCKQDWITPEIGLIQSLYGWGLEQLQAS